MTRYFAIVYRFQGDTFYYKGAFLGFSHRPDEAQLYEFWSDASAKLLEATAALPSDLRGVCEVVEILVSRPQSYG